MSIDNIAAGRRKEIAEEFDDLLSEGKDTEEATQLLMQKYSLAKADIETIVREDHAVILQDENDEPDDDPDGGGRVA